jgi:predicted RNase H-like nuclease
MRHYKKRPQGEAERLAVLRSCFAPSPTVVQTALDRYLRKQLARDDIYDALVNAVTATRLDKMMKTLPPEPTKDTLGLPMQMVYTLP